MLTRRELLRSGAILFAGGCIRFPARTEPSLVNDIHSQLNPTWVGEIAAVGSNSELISKLAEARFVRERVSISGSRHAMGGQQFGDGTILFDMRRMNRVLDFDRERGLIDVEAGIEWPELIGWLVETQKGDPESWGIAQKQTGADRLTIGGALSANAHGRGLKMKPLVSDIESFRLIDATGRSLECSRTHNRELFSLVAGGYGLFGVITSATLRLVRRTKLERVVELGSIDTLIQAFDERIRDGYTYGDFQFSIDEGSDTFLREGVFSCYRPVSDDTPIREIQKELTDDDWRRLILLAHTNKAEAYRVYSSYYLSTTGQIYWSDTQQLSTYFGGYHRQLDQAVGSTQPATEIITEIYVPRARLSDFMEEAREDFLMNQVNVFYGTVRLIEHDDESFLAWAKQPYACLIFNLHTLHTPGGIEHSAAAFRRLIDMAIRRRGSYYLTYHRYARRDQVEACYPQFRQFLQLKKKFDPGERFQSDWYRHYKAMFRV